MSFEEQIHKAKVTVKELKRITPYIFPQWQRLQNAQAAYEKAQDELNKAIAAWEAV